MKHILISGAASGIGLDLTKELLKAGHTVWAAARKPELLKSLQKQYPLTLKPVKLDVTSEKEINNVYKKISLVIKDEEFVLINNAGVAIAGPLEAVPLEEWRKLFDVNVFGLVRLTQAFLPLLRQTKGRVINVGSIAGRVASPFMSTYSASKFAVRAISDALRRELAYHGVKVVLIEPGPIKTPIWKKAFAHGQQMKQRFSSSDKKVYGKAVQALAERTHFIEKTAAPVAVVTAKILAAIERKTPQPYYLAGHLIQLQAMAVHYLPTQVVDKVLR